MNKTTRVVTVLAGVLLVGVIAVLVIRSRGPVLPAPGSEPYEQMTRAFYWGLSALEVGLLEDALQQFTKATTIVPEEPAAWADLGLTQLRLGELDAAVAPIERALELAPTNSDVMLLAARMEAARGRLDEAVTRLRRAVELDPEGLRARFALADELQRLNTPEADQDALALLDEIVRRSPNNMAALIERARVAARRADEQRVRSSRDALAPLSTRWSVQAQEQFKAFDAALEARRFEDAARATTFLRNVLAPDPEFRAGLAALRTPAELIAEPFNRFLALVPPVAEPSPPDAAIRFSADGQGAETATTVLPVFRTIEDDAAVLFAADGNRIRLLDGSNASWPLAARRAGSSEPPADPVAAPSALAALDWNHDFRTDVVVAGRGGLQLLLQDDTGTFTDSTARAAAGVPVTDDLFAAWPADIEMDGDIDIVVAPMGGSPFVLRNNGDVTWQLSRPFAGIDDARAFGWADLDQDADPDAMLVDEAGTPHVFLNRQAGVFADAGELPEVSGVIAASVGDVDADGRTDIVLLESSGALRRITRVDDGWIVADVAMWPAPPADARGRGRLMLADLDNNGALDVVASAGGTSRAWLADAAHQLQPLSGVPDAQVFAAVDRNIDGRVDLAAVAMGRPVWLMGGGGQGSYHWKTIRPRAQATAGDQRINSFGIGGEISVRSGLLVQTQVLTGTPVHFGLGTHTAIDVARIVWPNGIPQAEFGAGVDDVIVAEQRLKGSCPWVFAWDGLRMGFVTDFLWRSPLGLRINAQDTAGVTQTEDWVRIAGDQLVPRDGFYDLRITAELWETHFFDHVALLVVDHPVDTEVFVDERFLPSQPPVLSPRAVRMVAPVTAARDERGRDVTDVIARRDGTYLASFARGPYQGIAQEHYIEFELSGERRLTNPLLVASGWIYPTDSSINVAIGQGGRVQPSGLALEALGPDGRWVVAEADLGFPAGKNKTMLIDLSDVMQAKRLRLRTNLEIYWDSLILAEAVDVPLQTRPLAVADAELRYRGYSATVSPRGAAPETPVYERKAGVTQRWRDLEGYHTRFGNVNALLSGVDDRYVIMNAGDELQLRFAEQPPPQNGWRRDYVLIGDGWEKDGDYNTGFSQTVLPLPSHDRPNYGSDQKALSLEHDPVYQRHRSDWEEYHTRYVTPAEFIRGLGKN